MNGLLQDFRYALRQIRRSPGFTAFAVITLALGIGANTAIYSIVDASVLHPLPFHDAKGIMTLWMTDTNPGGYSGLAAVSDPDTLEWRKQSSLLKEIAFCREHTSNLTGVNDAVRLVGAEASANLFSLLEMNPALGRTFLPEEESAGKNRVVLLSHKLWQNRFAADNAVVGRSIRLDGQFFTVVGVMPAGFDFPNEAEFWTPLTITTDGSNATLKFLARLKPGASLDQARAEVSVVAQRLDKQNHRDSQATVALIPLETAVASQSRVSMFVLLGAVGLLLLIGCANVANLLLARAASRGQEIAIRNALGATRGRIIRQLLTESGVLACLGGVFGLLLAYVGRGVLVSGALSALPRSFASPGVAARIATATIDHSVLLFTLAVSLLTGILFGLAPVLQASGPRPNSALRMGARGSVGSFGKGRLRDAFVIAEIALAFVLLTSAGLLVRSFIKLVEVDPGFEPQNVLSMNVDLPEWWYRTPAQMISFEEQALEKLRALPGVASVGSVFGLPLGDILVRGDFVVENQPAPPGDISPAKVLVGGDYFTAIGIPVVNGRAFNVHDSETAPHVVVVSRSLARRLWPNQDPIGRRLKPGFSHDSWCTVVGVVGDVKQFDLRDDSAFALYFPYAQAPEPFLMQTLALVVRSRSDDPSATAAAARHAIATVDPDLPLFDVASMDQLVYRSLSEPRFNTFLLALFAALALLLAALGTYGVMSCVVTARTNEIGVRIALGASQVDVLREILGRVMFLAAVGLGAGLLGSGLASCFLASQLYDVRPTDLATYVVVSTLMIAASLLAGYIPARRAAKVDPMVALRYE
jgi:putative ABC transport system permease protein